MVKMVKESIFCRILHFQVAIIKILKLPEKKYENLIFFFYILIL